MIVFAGAQKQDQLNLSFFSANKANEDMVNYKMLNFRVTLKNYHSN